MVQFSQPYMTTGKAIALTRRTFVGKVMSLLFNMLSRLIIAFLPRSKRLSISWLQSPSAVILEPKKINCTVSIVSPSICHEVMGLDAMISVFLTLSFKPDFSLSSVTFIKRLLSSASLSAIRVVSSVYLRLLIFLLAILIPACASSSPTFCMMYSACKLNKQGDLLGMKASLLHAKAVTVLWLVAQLYLTLSPPGSSVHGILQARIQEWVAMSSSRGSPQPRYCIQVFHIAGGLFTIWATREAHEYWSG